MILTFQAKYFWHNRSLLYNITYVSWYINGYTYNRHNISHYNYTLVKNTSINKNDNDYRQRKVSYQVSIQFFFLVTITTRPLRWSTEGITIAGVTGVNDTTPDKLRYPFDLTLDWAGNIYMSVIEIIIEYKSSEEDHRLVLQQLVIEMEQRVQI